MSGHEHSHHSHSHGIENLENKNILLVFLLNLTFSIIEFIGGILTNSVAILSDALHDFGDALSIGISYILKKKSGAKANNKYTYGYRRLSIVGSLITVFVLVLGSFFILKEAVLRLFNPETVNSEAMIYLAILGIAINGIAYLRVNKFSSFSSKAISLHALEDVMGWMATLFASIIIYFTNLYFIDSILSIFIASFVLYNAYKLLKNILNILLQVVPSDINIQEVKNKIKSKFPDILDIQDLHIWQLDEKDTVASMHILTTQEKLEIINKEKQNIKELLHLDYKINHTTIEIDCNGKSCEF